MGKGTVVSIHLARTAGDPMVSVPEVRAVPDKGLEGDRYFNMAGTYSKKARPDNQVTLIEAEVIEALQREYQIDIDAGDARRNIVTRGVPLNELVGREIQVGEVTLRCLRLCEPCSHLAQLTARDVLPGLVHRGGLRAQIVTEGVIRVGDPIEER